MKKFLLYANIDSDALYSYYFFRDVARELEAALGKTKSSNINLYLHCFLANPLRIADYLNTIDDEHGQTLPVNPFRIATPQFQSASDFFDKNKVQPVKNPNHASGAALSEFINSVFVNSSTAAISNNDILTMWGHGNGRGLSMVSSNLLKQWSLAQLNQDVLEQLNLSIDESFTDSLLYPAEIATALNGNKLGLIAFNSCFAGTIEFAVSLSNNASYMLAPPVTALENSLKYQDWYVALNGLKNGADGKAAGEIAIRLFKAAPESGVMYSLTDLSKMERVKLAVTSFVISAKRLINIDPSAKDKIIDAQTSCRPFDIPLPDIMCIDLHQFAVELGAIGLLKKECTEITNSIKAAIVARTNDVSSANFDSSIYGLTVMIPNGEIAPYPSIAPFNKTLEKVTNYPAFNDTGWFSLMGSIYQK
jgi:hypothetical protein